MLETLKERVRERVWNWLGPQAKTAASGLPLGVDRLENLPIHYDPPECPLCLTPEGFCHGCGDNLINTDAPFGYGVESATVTHLHLHAVQDSGGKQVRTPARRKLCIPCFRIDWAKAYPGKPCDL